MKLHFMFKRFIAFLVLIATFQVVTAQISVTGKVIDQSSGAPIPNVSITVKGSNRGTNSDASGAYKITLQTGDAILLFTSTGYTQFEAVVNKRTKVDVSLAPSSTNLSEVVVVGYGSQSKKDVTGAVSSIKGDQIQNLPVSGATQALQGRVAGVNVVRSGGSPGSTGSIRIRGTGTINNADPLIVIDGIPSGDLNSVNPNDIASVEILKDASASAIYGTRAANGVVIVTTKRGNFEQPLKVSVNSYTGSSKARKTLSVLDAPTLVSLKKERYTNDGIDMVDTWNDPYNLVQRTNWQKELFGNGITSNMDVSLTGGSAKSSFMISAGVYDEKGIIKNSYFKRYSLRINSDHKIGKRLKLGQSMQLTRGNDNSLNTLSSQDGLIWSAVRFMPFIPVKNDDGTWGSSQRSSNEYGDINNPIFTSNTVDATNINTRLLANVNAEYEILKGLKLKTNLGVDGSQGSNSNFSPIIRGQTRARANNSLSRGFGEGYSLLSEYFLSYSKLLGKHKIDAVAGYTAQTFDANSFYASKRDFPNEDFSQRYLDAGQNFGGIGGNRSYDALQSGFGRVNYDYAKRYLLTMTFRADGSSKFDKSNRWGYFPAFSAAWRISNEKFFNVPFINDLKLTGGWGQLGNQNVASLQYLALIGGGGHYVFGSNQVVSSAQVRLPNYNISWETAQMTNIGLSAEMFNRSLQVNINYFDKTTNDMLLAPPTIGTVGRLSIPDKNVGVLSNKGVEIDLTYKNTIGELSYRIGANASFIENKVIKLFDGNYIGSTIYGRQSQEISRTYEGMPLGIFYGWKTNGLYQTQAEINSDPNLKNDSRRTDGLITPGDVRFIDINGDGQITEADRSNIGSPHPKMVYGFNTDFNYKSFDLSLFFLGNQGVKLFNADRMQGIDPTYPFNMYAEVANRWHGANTSNTIPRMSTKRNNLNYRTSDMFIEDGSFLRLKNISLGYTFKESLTKKFGFGKTRFYVSGQNVLTFTKYSGLDPELGYIDGNKQMNVDYAQYPQSRTWTVGLNVSL
jgi:TonB-dependent starch-binding outer membrane protein SusC